VVTLDGTGFTQIGENQAGSLTIEQGDVIGTQGQTAMKVNVTKIKAYSSPSTALATLDGNVTGDIKINVKDCGMVRTATFVANSGDRTYNADVTAVVDHSQFYQTKAGAWSKKGYLTASMWNAGLGTLTQNGNIDYTVKNLDYAANATTTIYGLYTVSSGVSQVIGDIDMKFENNTAAGVSLYGVNNAGSAADKAILTGNLNVSVVDSTMGAFYGSMDGKIGGDFTVIVSNSTANTFAVLSGSLASITGTSSISFAGANTVKNKIGGFDAVNIAEDAVLTVLPTANVTVPGQWNNAGTLAFDMTDATELCYRLVDYTGPGAMTLADYGTVTVGDGFALAVKDSDLYAISKSAVAYITVDGTTTYYASLWGAIRAAKDLSGTVEKPTVVQLMPGVIQIGSIYEDTFDLSNVVVQGAADGTSTIKDCMISFQGGYDKLWKNVTFRDIVWDASYVQFSVFKSEDLAFIGNTFTNQTRTGSIGGVHFTAECKNFVYANNLFTGGTDGSIAAINSNGAGLTGSITITNNVFRNSNWRSLQLMFKSNDGVDDALTVRDNWFAGNAKSVQIVGSGAESGDTVVANVNCNVFDDVTTTSSLVIYGTNPGKTTYNNGCNYYVRNPDAAPGAFYANWGACTSGTVYDFGVYPYYGGYDRDSLAAGTKTVREALEGLVQPTAYIAKADGTKPVHMTAALAIEAATKGERVKMIVNSAESVTLKAGVTLDPNGTAYTGTVRAVDGSVIAADPDGTFTGPTAVVLRRDGARVGCYDTIPEALDDYNKMTDAGAYVMTVTGGVETAAVYAFADAVFMQSTSKSVTLKPADGQKVTFKYANGQYGAILNTHGASSHATLAMVIDGIAFDLTDANAAAAVHCIAQQDKGDPIAIAHNFGSDGRYSSNLTLQNCSFVGHGDGSYALLGNMSGTSPSGITFRNCQAVNLGNLVNSYISNDSYGLVVENCHAADCGYLVNQTGNGGAVVVRNSSMKGYGGFAIRANSALTVSGCAFTNVCTTLEGGATEGAFVILRDSGTLTISDTTFTDLSAEGYAIHDVKNIRTVDATITANGTIDDLVFDNRKIVVAAGAYYDFQVVARIGSTNYGSLKEALDAANATSGATVTIMKDAEWDGANDNYFAILSSMTIASDKTGDARPTLTFVNGQFAVFVKNAGIDVTLRGIKIVNAYTATGSKDYPYGICVGRPNATVTLDNADVSSQYYAVNVPAIGGGTAVSGVTVNVTNGSTLSGWAAVNDHAVGTTINADGSTLVGTNAWTGDATANFGTVVLDGRNGAATFADCTVKAVEAGDFKQRVFLFGQAENQTGNAIKVAGGTIACNVGKLFDNATEANVISVKGEIAYTDCQGDAKSARFAIPDGYAIGNAGPDGYRPIVKAAASIATGDPEVKTFYSTLAAAIAAARTNDVIVLVADNAEQITMTTTVPFSINRNGHELTGSVTPAPDHKFVINGDGTCSYMAKDYVAQLNGTKYESLAEAVAAAQAGDTVEIIKAGEHAWPALKNGIALKGAADGAVTFPCAAGCPSGLALVTFENLAFAFGDAGDAGFADCTNVVFEGCSFSGRSVASGWQTYAGCRFESAGTALLLDADWTPVPGYAVVVTNCTFANPGAENGPAVRIESLGGATGPAAELGFDVDFLGGNVLAGSWPAGPEHGAVATNGLWGVDGDGTRVTVRENGRQVYPYVTVVVDPDDPDRKTTVTTSSDSSVNTNGIEQVVKDEKDREGIVMHTDVSGVMLTTEADAEGNDSGVQQALDRAKASGTQEFNDAVASATDILIDVSVEVTPLVYDKGSEDLSRVTYDLAPTATVTAVTGGTRTSQTVPVDNGMIDRTKPIAVTMHSSFPPQMVVHRDDDGNVIDVFSEGEFEWNAEEKTVTIWITHFSEVDILAAMPPAAIGGQYFPTVFAALTNAAAYAAGEAVTVSVLKSVEETFGKSLIFRCDLTVAASEPVTLKVLDASAIALTCGGSALAFGRDVTLEAPALTLTGKPLVLANAADVNRISGNVRTFEPTARVSSATAFSVPKGGSVELKVGGGTLLTAPSFANAYSSTLAIDVAAAEGMDVKVVDQNDGTMTLASYGPLAFVHNGADIATYAEPYTNRYHAAAVDGDLHVRRTVAVFDGVEYNTIAAACAAAASENPATVRVIVPEIDAAALPAANVTLVGLVDAQGRPATKVTGAVSGALAGTVRNLVFAEPLAVEAAGGAFENCAVRGTAASGTGALAFRDCTVSGANEFAQTVAVVFDGCTFAGAEGVAGACRTAGAMVVTNGTVTADWVAHGGFIGNSSETALTEVCASTYEGGSVVPVLGDAKRVGVIAVDATKDADGAYLTGTFIGKEANVAARLNPNKKPVPNPDGTFATADKEDHWIDWACYSYATPVDTEHGIVTIASNEELGLFAKQVNGGTSYAGYTVTIAGEIDLAAHEWVPVDAADGRLSGATFAGGTVKNLRTTRFHHTSGYDYYSGFIARASGSLVFRDIAFAGASVAVTNGSGVAVVLGLGYGNTVFDRVTLTDCTVDATTKAGLLQGFTGGGGAKTTVLGCTLAGTNTVRAAYSSALLVGLVNEGDSFDYSYEDVSVGEDSAFEWISRDGVTRDVEIAGVWYNRDGATLWLADPGPTCWAERRVAGATHEIGGTTYSLKGSVFYPTKVAQVGEERFCSLGEAFAAVTNDGAAVTLLTNVTQRAGAVYDRPFAATLDLDGRAFSATNGIPGTYALAVTGGTLAVTNGVVANGLAADGGDLELADVTVDGTLGVAAGRTVRIGWEHSVSAAGVANHGTIAYDVTGATADLVPIILYTGEGEMTLADYGALEQVGGGLVYSAQVVDGSLYASQIPVAKIGDKTYTSLQKAVDACPTDGTETTITLLDGRRDGDGVVSGVGVVTKAGQNVVLDFAGILYSAEQLVGSPGTESNGFQLLAGSKVTMKGGTLTSTAAKILVQNYADFTAVDMLFDGTRSPDCGYVISNNNGSFRATGSTSIWAKEGAAAFDVCATSHYPDGVTVTVDTTGVITGRVEYGVWDGLPAENRATLAFTNGTLVGAWEVDPRLAEAAKTNLNVYGGTFDRPVPKEYCAPWFVPVKNPDGTYGVSPSSVIPDNVAAAQRYPWNGLVDVTFTLRSQKDATVTVSGTCGDGTPLPVKDILVVADGATNAYAGASFTAPASAADVFYRVTWDSNAEGPTRSNRVEGVVFRVTATEK